jgi:hypothetical protein
MTLYLYKLFSINVFFWSLMCGYCGLESLI